MLDPHMQPFDFGTLLVIKKEFKGRHFSEDDELLAAWEKNGLMCPKKCFLLIMKGLNK